MFRQLHDTAKAEGKKITFMDIAYHTKTHFRTVENWYHGRTQPKLCNVTALSKVYGKTPTQTLDILMRAEPKPAPQTA